MKTLLTLLLVLTTATALAGPDHTVQDFPSADGVMIHAESWNDGNPVIVLVHGWSCDGSYWANQVADLAKDHRVVTIDLAGHGQSQAGRKAYTMAAFGQDVAAVLNGWDLDNVILVGHSMGGAVITEAALAVPDRVKGLIGVDNFQKVNMVVTDQQVAGFVSTFDRNFPVFTKQWVTSMFAAGADSVLVEEISSDMAAAPAEVGLSALEELLRWYGGLAPAQLKKITVPLMCVNSDKEPTDKTAMLALRPDFKVRYLPGTGHFLFRENPAAFNQLLRETIAEMLPK